MPNDQESTNEPEQEPETLARIVIANLPQPKIMTVLPGPALYPTVKELTDQAFMEGPKGES